MQPFAMRPLPRRLLAQTGAIVLLIAGPAQLMAQDVGPNPLRVSVMTGGLAPRSAFIVDARGSGHTRLGAAPALGLDVQYEAFGSAALYASGAVAFATLHHGTSLGVSVRGATSDAVLYAVTGGLVLYPFSGALRPIVRLGGGLKGYSFNMEGAEGAITPTGDFGLGFRAGTGAVELGAEVRYLPSVFDQAKLPTRGIVAQDQRQTDLLFGITITVRP
ncbi:MAG: hypothetical protein ACT4P6_03615 [Gemmatimonadaceae bacterium]